jgi:putative endonuclease
MPEDRIYWVYILASRRHGTLYVGVTNSLENRVAQHKAKEIPGFTKTYGVDRLVWFRAFGEVTEAIHFEKQLKRWRREWKINLIESDNPYWHDLYVSMMAEPPGSLSEFMGPGLSLRENRDDTIG